MQYKTSKKLPEQYEVYYELRKYDSSYFYDYSFLPVFKYNKLLNTINRWID